MKKRVTIGERDLRLLRIFRLVAEAGGLSAAEAKLGMERSTISRHLQALEGRLGGLLCSRGVSGFELTELGQNVFKAALTAQDAISRVQDELDQSLNGLTGELFIGIADNTITNPGCRIPEVIARFQSIAPAVEVHLSIRPTFDLVDDILMRRLDCAVFAVPLVSRAKLAAVALFTEEFRLYAGGSAPPDLSLKTLAQFGFAVVMRDGYWQNEVLASEIGTERRDSGRGLEAVALLVASGRYVGFLPTHLIGTLARRHDLREVKGAEYLAYVKTFSLVHELTRPLSAACTIFANVAKTVHEPKQSVADCGGGPLHYD